MNRLFGDLSTKDLNQLVFDASFLLFWSWKYSQFSFKGCIESSDKLLQLMHLSYRHEFEFQNKAFWNIKRNNI